MHRLLLRTIRAKTRAEEISIVTHALVEAGKDGIMPEDIEAVLSSGKIIEEYPERYRCLVYGTIENNIPVHVLCEYYDYLLDSRADIVVVTVYVPDPDEWIAGQIRKPTPGGGE